MTFEAILVVAALLVAYGLVSARLERWSISGPLVFTAVGVLLGPSAIDVLGGRFDEGAVELMAEATLVLLLFGDATRIDLRLLRSQVAIPARMLGIGLPLTLAAGTFVTALAIDDLSLAGAAVVAAVLTPTDAALGQAVVGNPRVPVRIRQALNVESGLNDGLMLPAIAVLTALAGAEAGGESATHWVEFAARQIGFGVLVGVGVGYAGGRAIDHFGSRGWVDGAMRQIATLALAVAAFAGAEVVEGNGFVAAFVAGMAFGVAARDRCHDAADFTEDEGQLLTLLTFLFFGALLLGPRLDDLTPTVALCSLAFLTVVRMVPVAISLIGLGLAWPTVAYLGWFGPRGLASILFGLSVVEEVELGGGDVVLDIVTWTVAASIVLHGLSAGPAAERYADWFAARNETMPDHDVMPEAEVVDEMRPRLPM
ncbi:MAG: cation:proton antiporter [Actinomycetota bacterium]